jgi:hypothetical protein
MAVEVQSRCVRVCVQHLMQGESQRQKDSKRAAASHCHFVSSKWRNMAPKKRNMDALDDLCGDESEQSSDEEAEKPAPTPKQSASSAAGKKLRVEDLERAGYQAGPSVLHVPEQRSQKPESTWDWGTGKGEIRADDGAPTDEVRASPQMYQYLDM